MEGREVCYHHGGATPVGASAPSFRHGRYSKHLPAPLAAKHAENLEAMAEVKRLDEGISLLDARICELCERLTTGERGTVWDDLQWTLGELDQRRKDGEDITPQIEALHELADKGKSTEQAWRDIDAAIHSKAKVSAMEAKRMADAGEIATKDEVKTLVQQIVFVVRDHVTPDQLRLISRDLAIVRHGRNAPQKPVAASISHQEPSGQLVTTQSTPVFHDTTSPH